MRLVAVLIVAASFAVGISAASSGQDITAETTRPVFNRFGAVEAFWLPDAACEIGIGWERIIFDWAQHQPQSADDWNTLNVDDRWLEAARGCGREVVAIVKHTPSWATAGAPNAGVPRGLYLPVDDPENVWARFMRRAAEYYAPRGVSRFIIWNEPDIPAGEYGFLFEGTLEDYAQLLKVAALAARAGNPEARIHIAGTTYWHDVNNRRRLYIDRLLEHLTRDPEGAANGFFFDALTVHVYFRTDTVTTLVATHRALLERYGMGDKAVWIVEMNASPNLDPAWPVTRPNWQVTLAQQSAFLLQGAALALAAGAERIAVYKFYDSFLSPGAESFGLIRADETRRPAFATWGMAAALFNDVDTASLAQTPEVSAVLLRHANGRTTLAAWTRTGEPAQLEVHHDGTPELRDAFGRVYAVNTGDRTTLLLPGAVCNAADGCAVGGQPVILSVFGAIRSVSAVGMDGETVLFSSR